MHIVPNLDSLKSSIVICDGIEHFSGRVLDASEPMRLLAIGCRQTPAARHPLRFFREAGIRRSQEHVRIIADAFFGLRWADPACTFVGASPLRRSNFAVVPEGR